MTDDEAYRYALIVAGNRVPWLSDEQRHDAATNAVMCLRTNYNPSKSTESTYLHRRAEGAALDVARDIARTRRVRPVREYTNYEDFWEIYNTRAAPEDSGRISDFMRILHGRDRYIMQQRIIDTPVPEIAKQLGLSEARIWQKIREIRARWEEENGPLRIPAWWPSWENQRHQKNIDK